MHSMKMAAIGLVAVAALTLGRMARADVDTLQKTGSAFAQIAKQALPAVVFVNVETTIEVPQRGYRIAPYEDQYGGRGRMMVPGYEMRKYKEEGQGSGFIITKDGYILTNNHVVNSADRIMVTLADGKKYKAKLVGTDPKTEVALIKIDAGDDLPTIPLGDSDAMQVGDWVLAAGNPFGLSQTVTVGIVSAKGRSGMHIAQYENFIQTDAAINPGNSGGPLLNIHGEAIGINTAIYSPTGGNMGIGFAIPIAIAKSVKDQLMAHGKVERGFLGIGGSDLTPDMASFFGLESGQGIVVNQVVPDSAAEEAGLKSDDVILELNGWKVTDYDAFRNHVASLAPGSELDLKVFRNGKEKTIHVTLRTLSDDSVAAADDSNSPNKLGISVENLDKKTANQFGYENDKGVVISEVEQGSSAWDEGLRPGLLITAVNRMPVSSVDEYNKAVAKALKGSDKALLLVNDGQSISYVVVFAN